MSDYITLEQASILYEIPKKNIYALQYNHSKSNKIRFKTINNKVYIHKNFQALLSDELQEVYYEAVYIAGSMSNLAKELSKLSGIKAATLERYFIRFTFTQYEKAAKVLKYMKKYIEQNPILFSFDELCA